LLLILAACSLWFSSGALLTANFLPHWYCLASNSGRHPPVPGSFSALLSLRQLQSDNRPFHKPVEPVAAALTFGLSQ
jgi:hypothetical protein